MKPGLSGRDRVRNSSPNALTLTNRPALTRGELGQHHWNVENLRPNDPPQINAGGGLPRG